MVIFHLARSLARKASQTVIAVLGLLSTATAGDLIVVDHFGTGDYSVIQDAISNAQSGDLILILPGVYNGFTITNKSLHVAAADGATVTLGGTVEVTDIAAGSSVTLRGLASASSAANSLSEVAGFVAVNNAGSLRIVDCQFKGFAGFSVPAAMGARIQSCANITFSSSKLLGAWGGGAGLSATDSNVAVYRTEIRGGGGYPAGSPGLVLLGTTGDFFATGCAIYGGYGPDGDCPEFGSETSPGDGGPGYSIQGSNAYAQDTTVQGGGGGSADLSFFWCNSPDGTDGPVGNGVLNLLPGTGRALAAKATAKESTSFVTLTFQGITGDAVYLQASLGGDFINSSRQDGLLLLRQPFLTILSSISTGNGHLAAGIPLALQNHYLGQIGANGQLVVQVPLLPSFLSNGLRTAYFQGIMIDVGGSPHMTEAAIISFIPCGLEADCNGNGIGDTCEINSGAALDCNANGVPDDCDPDCNLNGVPDICDLSSGFSSDLNGNGFPDECEAVMRLYVNGTAMPGGDGLSWSTAFRDLQDALTFQRQHVLEVEEIWVARGLYIPTSSTDRGIYFAPGVGARLRGGFAGTEAFLYQRDLSVNTTLLSGDLLQNDQFPAFTNENSWHVVFLGDGADGVMLDGFTIRGGRGDSGSLNAKGGGVSIESARDFLFSRCTIENSQAWYGAGVYVGKTNFGPKANGDFINCVIKDNGVYTGASSDLRRGGGVNVGESERVRFINCEILRNHATTSGGAAFISSSAEDTHFLGCTIWGNSSALGGGGIQSILFFPNHTPIEVQGCVLWNNTGANLLTHPEYRWQLNGALEDFNVIRSAIDRAQLYPGNGNINSDPLFVNSALGDLRLGAGSPCIDAGRNGAIPNEDPSDLDQDGNLSEELPFDLGGLPRRIDDPTTTDTGSGASPVVDMGAHEFDPAP